MAAKKALRSASLPVKDWHGIRSLRMLLRAHSRLVDAHKRHIVERHGLKMSEFDMIASLGNTAGLRMGDLAAAMITSPANVTRVAAALEKRGLVARKRSEHSDREVVAYLTSEGEAAFGETFLPVAHFSCDLMEAGLSGDELETLAALCAKLAEVTWDPPRSG